MRQSLDQIAAAIPFRGLGGVGLAAAWRRNNSFQPAITKRRFNGNDNWLCGRRADRLPRHQKGIKRVVVLVGDVGEMIIRKGRIEMLAVAIDAGAHRAAECRLRPAADAGVGVGRDVGGIDGAERCRHGRPPAKALPPRAVWQSLQLPIAARSRPRLTNAVNRTIAARGVRSRQWPAATSRQTRRARRRSRQLATMLPMIRGDAIVRTCC